MVVELHAIFKGRVQGVFFRDTTRRFARELNIYGSVENLSDGSVELFAQGTKENLEKLLENLQDTYGEGVSSLEKSYSDPKKILNSFQIR